MYNFSKSFHRENSYDQTPQSLYDQDVALSGNCVAVIGRASEVITFSEGDKES